MAELAARLAAAKTPDERKDQIAKERELVTPALVRALVREGSQLSEQGSYAQALALDTLAQDIALQLGDNPGRVDALLAIGDAYADQQNLKQALENLQACLNLAEQIGYQAGVAHALSRFGFVQLRQGDTGKAMEYLQKSLELSEKIGHREVKAISLNGIGVGLMIQGRFPQALEFFQRSLLLREDPASISRTLINLGIVYRNLGDYAKSLEHFEQALNLAEKAGSRWLIPTVLNDIGSLYSAQGNNIRALEYFYDSLRQIERLEQPAWMADVLGNIAGIHEEQGNFEQALATYQKAMDIFRKVGDQTRVVETLTNLGNVQAAQGTLERALKSYQQARQLSQKLGNLLGIADALRGIASVHASRHRYDRALSYYSESLKRYQELGQQEGVAATLNQLSDSLYERHSYAEALERAERAVDIARRLGAPETLWRALETVGKANRALGNFNGAHDAFAEAIETIETMRAQAAGGEQERQLFFERRVGPYYEMVSLLSSQARLAEALLFAERAKGRVLLDVLQQGRTPVIRAMTAGERAQEEKLNGEIVSLNTQISQERGSQKPNAARVSTLENGLQRARLDLESFQTSLYAAHPELKLQRGHLPPLTPEQLSPLLANGKRALLEFAVGQERSFLFVLTKEVEGPSQSTAPIDLRVYPIEMRSGDLARMIHDFRKRLAERDSEFRPIARRLHRLLLAPAAEQLAERTEFCIVPDGPLWELPFQALLVDGKRYLVEDAAISYAPSLAIIQETLKGKATARARGAADSRSAGNEKKTLLAFGNPTLGRRAVERIKAAHRDEALAPLPDAEKEVEALGQLYGLERSTILKGDDAREDRAKAEADQYRVIHFAAHGILDDQHPLYSHIVLAQPEKASKEDGLLEAWEVMNMNLRCEMVVLSACQTARGRVGAGEGIIGMSWAFFVAGVATAVVSQWSVDSASTTELMVDFHRSLAIGGISKAEALRRAELNLLHRKQYFHPFYWAGFVVVGNGL